MWPALQPRGPNYLALFDDAVPTTLLRCDGFSSGVYDEIQETVRAHYDHQIAQIDGDIALQLVPAAVGSGYLCLPPADGQKRLGLKAPAAPGTGSATPTTK